MREDRKVGQEERMQSERWPGPGSVDPDAFVGQPKPAGRQGVRPDGQRSFPSEGLEDAAVAAPGADATRVYVTTPDLPDGEPRSSRVYLARVGPLSVLKFSLIFGALAMAAVLAGLFVLYQVLDATGVLRSIEKAVNTSGLGHHFQFRVWAVFRPLLIGGFATVLIASLIASFLGLVYNAVSELAGGLDVTFVERARKVVRTVPGEESRIVMTRSTGDPETDGDTPAPTAQDPDGDTPAPTAQDPDGYHPASGL